MANGKKRPKKKTGSKKTDLQKAYQNQWKRINSNIQKLEKQGFTVDRSFLPRQLSHPRWVSVESLRGVKMRNIRPHATVIVGETEFKASDIYHERRRQQLEKKRQQRAKQKAQTPREIYSDNTGSISGTDSKAAGVQPVSIPLVDNLVTTNVTVGEQPTPIVVPIEEHGIETTAAAERYGIDYESPDWLGEDEYSKTEVERAIPATDLYPTPQALLKGSKFERGANGEDIIVTPKGEQFFKGSDGRWYTLVQEKPTIAGNALRWFEDLLPDDDYFMKAKNAGAWHENATDKLLRVKALIDVIKDDIRGGSTQILENISNNFQEIEEALNGYIQNSDKDALQEVRFGKLYKLIYGEAMDAITALQLNTEPGFYYRGYSNKDDT